MTGFRSEEVAARFIQSVILVDDRAFRPLTMEASKAPSRLRSPFSESASESEIHVQSAAEARAEVLAPLDGAERADSKAPRRSNEDGRADEEPTAPDARTRLETLDAAAVIRSFARGGVVCAVVEPSALNDEQAVELTVSTAGRADVVVLDWYIHEDDLGGETTKKIIGRILEQDEQSGGRLRLIAIYTGEPNASKVLDALEPLLSERRPRREAFALACGSLRVVVLRKAHEHDRSYSEESDRFACTETDLPKVIWREFAELTSGLVSNAAVNSLSVLRRNTHALLAHLDARLDAAFLSHRAQQQEPEDSVLHLEELVTNEIGAMLNGLGACALAGETGVAAWLAERAAEGYQHESNTWSKEQVHALVVTQEAKALEHVGKGKLPFQLTRILQWPKHADYDADAAFTVSMSMVRRYGTELLPVLGAGTVLRSLGVPAGAPKLSGGADDKNDPRPPTQGGIASGANDRYLVCVQPPCDSVRLDQKGRPFLFLPASVQEDLNGKFDLVVQDATGQFVRLRWKLKAYELLRLNFKPSTGEQVVRAIRHATEGDQRLCFLGDEGDRYDWVGQMKRANAQSLMNGIANDLGRIGLSESEWLRKSREKGSKG